MRVVIPVTKPKFYKAKLLGMPNIPKPLHGLNPRTLLGADWWKQERQRAGRKNNYCCHVCGVSQVDVGFLEGHEVYKINYANALSTYIGTVAVCTKCHMFIHLGRTNKLYAMGKLSKYKYYQILKHGQRLLEASNITMFYGTAYYFHLAGMKHKCKVSPEPVHSVWSAWRLKVKSKKYKGKFKNHREWEKFYTEE